MTVNLNITKTVTGPASGDRTFQFGVYYDSNCTSAVSATPVSITVNGASSATVNQSFTIPASCLSGGSTNLYVKELSTTSDQYWTYDNTEAKEATVSRLLPSDDVTFTNAYAPKGTLTVEKEWAGAAGTASVTFDVQKETATPGTWTTVSTGNTLNSGNKWNISLGNLDLNTNYRVLETGIQDYNTSYDKAFVTFTASSLEQTIKIINTYETPKGKITVNKTWSDNENAAGDRPDQIQFNYTGPTEGTLTLTKTGNWSNFLETTAFGTYTFTEVVPQDYTAKATSQSITISQEPIEDREKTLAFENTYVEPKGTLSISKAWSGDEGKTDYRPTSIIVQLFHQIIGADNAASEEQVGNDIIMTPDANNNWVTTFNNLAFGSYRVQENDVKDYTNVTTPSALSIILSKSIDGNISSRIGGITINNSFTNPTGSIEVKKTWVESDVDSSEVRPTEITVDLKAGNEVVATTTLSAVNETAANVWSYTFKDLPLDGTKYTVSESGDGDNAAKLGNYEQKIAYGGDGGSETGMVLDRTHRGANVFLTNTYAKGTLTIHKDWSDGTNENLPESATVTLYMSKTEEINVTSEAIETNEDGTDICGN